MLEADHLSRPQEAFAELLATRAALLVGLLRSGADKGSPLPYVLTNPPLNTPVKVGDIVYVISRPTVWARPTTATIDISTPGQVGSVEDAEAGRPASAQRTATHRPKADKPGSTRDGRERHATLSTSQHREEAALQ